MEITAFGGRLGADPPLVSGWTAGLKRAHRPETGAKKKGVDMEKTYIFHFDAGHGWLEVKRAEVERLGLAGRVSACSYQRGGNVYLEEDVDAGLFIKVAGVRQGQIRERNDGDRSAIRAYASYGVE